MRRIISTVGVALLLTSPQLAAQQQITQSSVYVAYYKVGYADLEEWIGGYFEYAVPVLGQLREEGIIGGWAAWQHNTGGEYNWRFSVIADEWSKLDTFWSEYLRRVRERSGEYFAKTSAMIQAHEDEIWTINKYAAQEGLESKYMYDSRFQVSFADMEQWNAKWSEIVEPVLNQAMADGILGAWGILGHNTGGRYNWKVIYWFEEWDDMDDLFERVTAALAAKPGAWEQIGEMVAGHDDVIWGAVTEPGEM